MNEDYKDGFKISGAVIVFGTVALLIVLLFSAMAVFGFGLFSQKTANFRGETSKRNQVEANGAFRVQAYDKFFDLCTSIQGDEARARSLEEELKTKPPADRVTQINASLAAIRSNRETSIRQYNNDAHKSYTVGQFRSTDLPYSIDPTEENTECAL